MFEVLRDRAPIGHDPWCYISKGILPARRLSSNLGAGPKELT